MASVGLKRSAAFGTVRTLSARLTTKSTVAVMPGSRRPSALSTSITTV